MASDGIPYPIFSLPPWFRGPYFPTDCHKRPSALLQVLTLSKRSTSPGLSFLYLTVLGRYRGLCNSFRCLVAIDAHLRYRADDKFVLAASFCDLGYDRFFGRKHHAFGDERKYWNVRIRRPFLTQIWLFFTPIAYSATLLGEPWRSIYSLNPMVGVVEGFRWASAWRRYAAGIIDRNLRLGQYCGPDRGSHLF